MTDVSQNGQLSNEDLYKLSSLSSFHNLHHQPQHRGSHEQMPQAHNHKIGRKTPSALKLTTGGQTGKLSPIADDGVNSIQFTSPQPNYPPSKTLAVPTGSDDKYSHVPKHLTAAGSGSGSGGTNSMGAASGAANIVQVGASQQAC